MAILDLRIPPFNTSLRQLQCEIEVIYKMNHRRIERSGEALDPPLLTLIGPIKIDEVYVSAEREVKNVTGRRARVSVVRKVVTNRPCSFSPIGKLDGGA